MTKDGKDLKSEEVAGEQTVDNNDIVTAGSLYELLEVKVFPYINEAARKEVTETLKKYTDRLDCAEEAVDYLCRSLLGKKPKSYKGEPEHIGEHKSFLQAVNYLLNLKTGKGGEGRGKKDGEQEPYVARDLVVEVVRDYFTEGGEGYKLLEATRTAAVQAGMEAGAEAGGKAIDGITSRVGLRNAKGSVPEDAQLAEAVARGLKLELDRRGVGGGRDEVNDLKKRLEAAEGGMEEFLKGFGEGGKVYNWMRELERRLGALEEGGPVDRTDTDSEEQDQDVDGEGSDRTNGKKKKHGKK